MKKNFIIASIFVGILMVSLASAGWWGDLFNHPPSVTGDVVNYRGMDLNLNKLSEGVQLSKGWNYWFIWKDSKMSVTQLVSGLDANSYKYLYEYNPQTRKRGYWYGQNNSKNQFDTFMNGTWYAIYMLKPTKWQYAKATCTDSDGGLEPSVFGYTDFKAGSFESKHKDSCALVSTYDSNGTPRGWQSTNCSGKNCYVEEAFCRTDENGNFIDADADKLIKCSSGCSNGECISSQDDNSDTVTYKGILDMLESCTFMRNSKGMDSQSGAEACKNTGKTCLVTLVSDVKKYSTGKTYSDQELASCNQQIGLGAYNLVAGTAETSFTALCCSPPS